MIEPENVILQSTASDELMRHGSCACRTFGVSMQPLFKTHRDVVVLEAPKAPLKKYDVVLYNTDTHKNVLHRIIGVRKDFYVIRGDNTYKKEYIKKEDILGVLVFFNRNGKKHSVTDFSYKLYSRLWNFIYPIRYFIRVVRSLVYRLYRKLFPKKDS